MLVNCTDLKSLLSLSSSLLVCLKMQTATKVLLKEKAALCDAIGGNSPPAVLEDDADDEQDKDVDVESQGVKMREISPFSIALRKRVAEKMKNLDDDANASPNLLWDLKIVDYLECYIFPLALLWSGVLLGKCKPLDWTQNRASCSKHTDCSNQFKIT